MVIDVGQCTLHLMSSDSSDRQFSERSNLEHLNQEVPEDEIQISFGFPKPVYLYPTFSCV